MEDYKLGAVEARFAQIIWAHAPVSTAELVKLCGKELNWKRTTTYTVLKRLGERGLFRLENGTVTVLIPREEFYARQSEKLVDDAFGGSLPAFLAAFTRRKSLTPEEIREIQTIINGIGGEP